MSSLLLLVPIAILLVLAASAAYMWAVRNHQFEDLDRESERILFDEVASNNKQLPNAESSSSNEPQGPEKKSSGKISAEEKANEGQGQ